MGFITCNQHTDFLSFTKQATFTPFAMDGIVGKVNINLIQNTFGVKKAWPSKVESYLEVNT